MKKPTKTKAITYSKPEQQALRRWCVEQASKWPTVTETTYGGGGMVGGGYGGASTVSRTLDCDVIGRAKRLEDYVLGK